MTRPRAVVSWSSGKDSAWALHVARTAGDHDIVGLLTTVTDSYDRVSMHGVRDSLLEAQARAVGLPCLRVRIPAPCPNEVYEARMAEACESLRRDGVTHVVFGDLFLEDIRAYRDERLARIGLTGVYPLWGRPTDALAREMVAGGLSAILTCVDPRQLDRSFAGRTFDARLLAELPAGVDPCGERGEFHTFVVAGPMLSAPVPARVGEVVERDDFVFADVLASTAVLADQGE